MTGSCIRLDGFLAVVVGLSSGRSMSGARLAKKKESSVPM